MHAVLSRAGVGHREVDRDRLPKLLHEVRTAFVALNLAAGGLRYRARMQQDHGMEMHGVIVEVARRIAFVIAAISAAEGDPCPRLSSTAMTACSTPSTSTAKAAALLGRNAG